MIPVSKPIIAKNAKKYLLDCLTSGWVSSKGPYVKRFEKSFAKFVGVKYAIATSSGTAALHLSLAAIRIGPGNEVIIPSLTMIATALPIIYCQAKPVLVDSEEVTGNINASEIEQKITKNTKAIIIVHLNGHPVDIEPILNLAKKHKLAVIEDAAEAHGAQYLLGNTWKKVGSLGDLGCFSLYGNKLVTAGEGGMVTTNNKDLAERVKYFRNLARSSKKHFYHQEVAFAYRMSALQAALGLAQLEEFERFLQIKNQLAETYLSNLSNLSSLILPSEKTGVKRIYWNYDILVKDLKTRDKLVKFLQKKGIESRIFVIPMHLQPAFTRLGLFKGKTYPISEKLSNQGLSLPLGLALRINEVKYICNQIKQFFKKELL